jgi:hypothetical protein
LERDLKEIFAADVSAADQREAVLRSLEVEDGAVVAGGERCDAGRIFVLVPPKSSSGSASRAA